MTDRQLETPEARAWRDAYRAGMRAGSKTCPGDEMLASLVLGEVSDAERQALARHITECRRCAEDYRTLHTLHRDTKAGLARHRRMRWRWSAVAAAAVLVTTLGVGLVWINRISPRGSDNLVRGDATNQRVVPGDGAVLDAPPAALSWPAQAGASSYRVRVYDESANLLVETRRVAGSSVALGAEALSPVGAGGAYFWTVEVEGPVTRSRLGPFWFRIRD